MTPALLLLKFSGTAVSPNLIVNSWSWEIISQACLYTLKSQRVLSLNICDMTISLSISHFWKGMMAILLPTGSEEEFDVVQNVVTRQRDWNRAKQSFAPGLAPILVCCLPNILPLSEVIWLYKGSQVWCPGYFLTDQLIFDVVLLYVFLWKEDKRMLFSNFTFP